MAPVLRIHYATKLKGRAGATVVSPILLLGTELSDSLSEPPATRYHMRAASAKNRIDKAHRGILGAILTRVTQNTWEFQCVVRSCFRRQGRDGAAWEGTRGTGEPAPRTSSDDYKASVACAWEASGHCFQM